MATAYAGHQFGTFAGQLGDGRAMTLGEVLGRQVSFTDFCEGKAIIALQSRWVCDEGHVRKLSS